MHIFVVVSADIWFRIRVLIAKFLHNIVLSFISNFVRKIEFALDVCFFSVANDVL